MPFPETKYCLIADGLRPEPLGKVTLLGFFGLAPDVSVNVKDFSKQLELGFLLIGGSTTDARGSVQFQIIDANEKVLLQSPVSQSDVPADGKRMMSAVQLTFVYPGPGKYAMRQLVDGKKHFDAWYQLNQGQKTDFQA